MANLRGSVTGTRLNGSTTHASRLGGERIEAQVNTWDLNLIVSIDKDGKWWFQVSDKMTGEEHLLITGDGEKATIKPMPILQVKR